MAVLALAALILAVAVGSAALTRRTAPLTARVHIDDLATGRAPHICAVTGQPTTSLVEVGSSRGGFQAWWLLLLFLGPIGIACIAVLYVIGGRQERTSGLLPISAEAIEHYDAAVKVARGALFGVVGVMVLGTASLMVLQPASPLAFQVGAAIAGVLLLVFMGAQIVAPTRWVDLRLDGSGRWVTVVRAHPAFAEAVRQRYLAEAPLRS